jgi:hypothetical protein
MGNIINIGKKETYCFQVDDNSMGSELARLKTYYERMEDRISNLDAGYSCKVGDAEMEYEISDKGFKKFAKDMKAYYDGLMKGNKDSSDAEIKALKEEISNRDSVDDLVSAKAKDLVKLALSAQKVLNCDSADLIDLSEREIKEKVIKQAYPNLDTANESEEGINAMFKVAQLYQEDSKKKVERHRQVLENVVRQPDVVVNYDAQELSPRAKAKSEAWKQSVGGVR